MISVRFFENILEINIIHWQITDITFVQVSNITQHV